MPKLDRDGVQIYYGEVHGSGPAIILSHGYSLDRARRCGSGQIEPHCRGDHTLILWDMRGHGQSDYLEDESLYSEAATVADIDALLDAVGAKTAIVGGLSLGGYMTLAYQTASIPSGSQAPADHRHRPGLSEGRGPRGLEPDRAEEDRQTLGRAGVGAVTKALSSLSAARPNHRSADGLARAARGMLLTQRDAEVINSRLPDIAVPSLVVVGAQDTPFLIAADYMAAKIPGAQKVVIPNAGHAANIDQPALFNQAVMAFLDGLERARKRPALTGAGR